jgi:O-acetylserine/cysteine efflux transporter
LTAPNTAPPAAAATAIAPRDLAIFLFVMLVWGSNFGFMKWGLLDLPPMLLVGTRFAIVAAMLLPFVRLPRDKLWPLFGVSVTLGSIHFGLILTGMQYVPAGTAAIAVQLQVPFAALLAAAFFNDRLGWRRAVGMAIAFCGIGLISGEPDLAAHPFAIWLIVGASFVWAVANIQVKRMGPVDGFTINAAVALFAAPQLLALSLLLEDGQWAALTGIGWHGVSSLFYQSVAVVIVGYGLWYGLLQRYPVNQAMPFTLLMPAVGVAAGVIMLGEALTWQRVVGGLITVVGVGIILWRRPQLTDPVPEVPPQDRP